MPSSFSSVISQFSSEEAPGPNRVCSISGRAFEQGDVVYSFLCEESGKIKRYDLCAEAKRSFNPPGVLLARWKSKVRTESEKTQRAKLAPNEALISLFASLADKPEQAPLRYALALLLARRRVFRFEIEENVGAASERENVIYVYSPREETSYVVPVVEMTAGQAEEVQAKLLELLDAPVAPNQFDEPSQEKTTDGTSESQETLTAFDSSELADAAEAAMKALEGELE